MNKFFLLLPLFAVLFLFFSSCNNTPPNEKKTILTGKIKVLVDESLAPIMREQLDVFRHSYINSDIELVEMPELKVVNALLSDSAEVAVLTRLLKEEELKFFEARGFSPRIVQFAVDAVALIANVTQGYTTITVEEVLQVMRGQSDGQISLVFDNPNSGTLRYLKDLAGVDSLPESGVYALNSQEEVIAYVHDHPSAIGVVGVNWMMQPDSTSTKLISSVRSLALKNLPGNLGDDDFYLPSQSNLALGVYAFSRPVYLINAEPRHGLGMGFAAFLSGDRGQRIVLKSGLMPDSLPPREIILRSGYRSN